MGGEGLWGGEGGGGGENLIWLRGGVLPPLKFTVSALDQGERKGRFGRLSIRYSGVVVANVAIGHLANVSKVVEPFSPSGLW